MASDHPFRLAEGPDKVKAGQIARLPQALRSHPFLAISLLYFLSALIVKSTVSHPDLVNFYVPAAGKVLEGHWLDIYQIRSLEELQGVSVSFPLTFGPHYAFLLAPFVWLAPRIGLHHFMGIAGSLVLVPVLIFDLLVAHEMKKTILRLRPAIESSTLLLGYILFLFSPLLWFSSVRMHNPYTLMLFCALVGLRLVAEERYSLAGAIFGMAILTKVVGIITLIPVVCYLVARRKGKALLKLACAAVLVACVVLGPYALLRGDDLYDSWFRFERSRPLYGITLWKPVSLLVGDDLSKVWANPLTLLLMLGISLHLIGLKGHELNSIQGFSVLVLCQLVFALMTKWSYPHQYLVPFVFFLIWDLSRQEAGRWPIASLAFLFLTLAIQDVHTEVGPYVRPSIHLRCLLWAGTAGGFLAWVYRQALPTPNHVNNPDQ